MPTCLLRQMFQRQPSAMVQPTTPFHVNCEALRKFTSSMSQKEHNSESAEWIPEPYIQDALRLVSAPKCRSPFSTFTQHQYAL